PPIPGVYTTTALADGSFAFRDLPAGQYCLTARQGDLIGVLSGAQIGGAHIAAPPIVHLAAGATINGKVRYAHPNETNPDNSGIRAFVKGTSQLGYTQGASGDYSIPNVPLQSPGDVPYTIVAVAGGFADGDVVLPQPVTGDPTFAPLIFLFPGATV